MPTAHDSTGAHRPAPPAGTTRLHPVLRTVAALAAGLLVLVLATACDNRVAVQPSDVVVSCFGGEECFEKGYAAETAPSSPDPDVADDKYARAAAYYDEGCDADHGAACLSGGMIYMMAPSGVIQDQPRAARMIEKSCALEHADGCSRAGDIYEDGWGVTPDVEQAAAYYQQACDLGHRAACHAAKRLGS